MRKILGKLLISVMIAAMLASSFILTAAAADYRHLADELNGLGLFGGTENGYELDRAPSRAEALVMLIRLLGLEETAKSGEFNHPFTDVDSWFSPYAGYAYEHGLTDGIGEGLFGPNQRCTAQMYVTYVLRALGYDDTSGDFTYDGAVEFAKSVGIIDDTLAGAEFLRDHLVAVSYLALSAVPKNGEYGSLLEKLIEQGAINETGAKATRQKLDLIDEYLAISSEVLSIMSRVSMNMSADAKMVYFGQSIPALNMSMAFSSIMEEDLLLEIIMDMSLMGEESVSNTIYVVDGYAYMDDGVDKVRTEANLADVTNAMAMSDVTRYFMNPAYTISDISKSTEGDYTVYTILFASGVFNTIINQAMGMVSGDVGLGDIPMGDMSIDYYEMKIYVDSSDMLNKLVINIDVTMVTEVMGTSIPIPLSIALEIEITAFGDDVVITLPDDLDTYTVAVG